MGITKMLYKNLHILLEVFLFSFSVSAQQDSLSRIIFQGEVLSGFGHQVCSGDFNGDKIDDIVITSVNKIEPSPLKISIFFGNQNLNTQEDVIIFSDTVYDNYYGYSLANAGDINNDGYDDLIVGFYQSLNYAGRVMIFLGGNPMNSESDLVLQGPNEYCGFGSNVSSAGDINGDGFSDFLIQSSIDWYFQTDTVKVNLYLGSGNLDATPDLIFPSPYIDDSFGSSIHSVGDINNDTYDDFIIGSKWNYNKVFLFIGGQTPDNIADYILSTSGADTRFGNSVCGGIDFNQDGFNDIIIGAHKSNIGSGYEHGRVYIYYGGISIGTNPDLILNGQEEFEHFGYNVLSIGYFNEDIYPDLMIGAPGSAAPNWFGKLYIYYGDSTPDADPDIILYGEPIEQFSFGTTLASVDFNSDGLNEFLLGNYIYDLTLNENILFPDRVYLYYFVPPAYKIQYSATNFIFEEPNSFTFDVYIKNNGNYPWQYRNGQITLTFNSSILRYGSLLWSIVPGFSDFPLEQQPDSAVVYNSYTIGTVATEPVEGYNFLPGEELRYGRFRIETTDTNFAIQPHYLRFIKTGSNKTQSTRWVWYDSSGKYFNSENIAYIDLEYELLPVELNSFTASVNQNKVQLNWVTVTELNNNGFEVQRKLENSDWITIGFVQGNGTTTDPTSYIFFDDVREFISNKIYYRLKQIDYNGNYEFSDEIEVITLPMEYSLSQNYPNPFNPSTTIEYQIPQSSFVTIKVYDALGKEVVTLVNEEKPAGVHEVNFQPKGLTSGLYLYKISAGGFEQTRKMLLLK